MTTSETDKHFVFLHRDLQYALPVRHVVEIVETPALLPFHGLLRGCLGNVAHRDDLMPLLDPTVLGTRRGIEPVPSKTSIIVRHEEAVFGLSMDRVVAVASLDEHSASTGKGELSAEHNPFAESVGAFRDNTLIRLSCSAIARLVRAHFTSQKLVADGKERPAHAAPRGAESEQCVLLCARIEQTLLGMPIELVREVIEGYDVTPLFKVPRLIRGLINLRGQVLACVDISSDLGLSPRILEEHNQFVILQSEAEELALCVDSILGIRRLPQTRIQEVETALSGDWTRYVAGVVEEEDATLFVLSVPGMLDTPQLQPYRSHEG
jgi:purine-binding chemotaxis protein CheW